MWTTKALASTGTPSKLKWKSLATTGLLWNQGDFPFTLASTKLKNQSHDRSLGLSGIKLSLISVSFCVLNLSVSFSFLLFLTYGTLPCGHASMTRRYACFLKSTREQEGDLNITRSASSIRGLFATPDKILTNLTWVQQFSILVTHQTYLGNFKNTDAWVHPQKFQIQRVWDGAQAWQTVSHSGFHGALPWGWPPGRAPHSTTLL